jgi:hypothetical protein
MTRTLALFFDTDEMTFTVTTTNPEATESTRTFNRFSDAAREVVDARVYEGTHFRTADVVARRHGRQVADWVFRHLLRPIDEERDDGD